MRRDQVTGFAVPAKMQPATVPFFTCSGPARSTLSRINQRRFTRPGDGSIANDLRGAASDLPFGAGFAVQSRHVGVGQTR